MFAYFVPYAYFLLLSGLGMIARKATRLPALAGLLVLTAFAGLRYDSDNDYLSYLELFGQIPPLTAGWSRLAEAVSSVYLEPLFTFAVALLKVVLPDKALFAVFAATSLGIYAVHFQKYSKLPVAALLLYIADGFYVREFTQLRFGLAVALVLAAICALYARQPRRFVYCVVAAGLIHYTAFFAFFLPMWLKFAHGRPRIVVTAAVFLALALSGAFDLVLDLFLGSALVPLRLLSYVDTSDAESVDAAFILIQFVLVVISAVSIDPRHRDYFFVRVHCFSFVVLCAFSGFDLLRRISFVFSGAMYFIFASHVRNRRLFPAMAILLYSLVLINARMRILRPFQVLPTF